MKAECVFKRLASITTDAAVLLGCGLLAFILIAALPFRLAASLRSPQIRTIVVEGSYAPREISLIMGRPAVLRFWRPNNDICSEKVVVDGLGIAAKLSPDGMTSVSFTPRATGRFQMHCAMNHLKGEIDVRDGLGPSTWWPVFF